MLCSEHFIHCTSSGADSGGDAPGARPPPFKKTERERGGGEERGSKEETIRSIRGNICNIFLTFSDRLLNAT